MQSRRLELSSSAHNHGTEDAETLSWVIGNERRAGELTDTFPGSKFLCIQLVQDQLRVSFRFSLQMRITSIQRQFYLRFNVKRFDPCR